MCLTIPGKIKSIVDGVATVENGARSEQIELGVVLDAKVGDWVLYATDRAVRKIDEVEAREIIELLEDNYQPVDIAALPLEYKKIIYKVRNPKTSFLNKDHKSELSKSEVEYLLNLKGQNNLEAFHSEANVLRKEIIKDFVCIHGIVEFSNYCQNNCLYCGIRRDAEIHRYRMSEAEIFMVAKRAVELEGYKLIVLQSGEDFSYTDDELIKLIQTIKKNLRVFIFISVGERSKEFYKRAFEAGATGSLFRFETSNPVLYAKLHPGHTFKQRLKSLEEQIKIGYYVASGGLIGLPNQSVSDMAQDLMLVRELGIPMLSSGPWIPSQNAPLGQARNLEMSEDDNIDKMRLTLNYYAAARMLMPGIKIPVTTALETLDPERGRHKGLLAGANALMFNITPEKFKGDYDLYDHKYVEREKVWQKYGLFKGEESYEMLEERLQI